MTAADIVLDASVLVRRLQRETDEAIEIIGCIEDGSIRAHAPDLIGPEIANALLRLLRAGRFTPHVATTMLEAATASRILRYSSGEFVRPAFEFAVASGLSAYDSFYAVLAEALDLPLVTADRKLAAAVGRAVLVA